MSDGELREGDLIIEVNGQEVKTVDELAEAAGSDNSIVLMLEREGSTYFIMVSKSQK